MGSRRSPRPRIRAARPGDASAILSIETRSFSGDRMSARGVRHALTRGHNICQVLTVAGVVAGYGIVLLRGGASVGRLYSLAIDRDWRGFGFGGLLLAHLERAARKAGCGRLRLEVRKSNRRALSLYRETGYDVLYARPDYYEDGMDAWRMEKTLDRKTR